MSRRFVKCIVLKISVFFGALSICRCADCPIELVQASASSFQVNEDALNYLKNFRPPLYFVPALGQYRTGKSFMLNRVRGLQAPYEGGFGIGHLKRTFTKGMWICAEPLSIDGGVEGTVVWTDTEGLDSADIREGGYSEKLSSLVLFLASVVMLNSHVVIRDSFCTELCEMDKRSNRIKVRLVEELKDKSSKNQALTNELQESLLNAMQPANPKIVWLVQQAKNYDNSTDVVAEVLDQFLGGSNDTCRQDIKRNFPLHLYHELPDATNATSKFNILDTLPDSELASNYVEGNAFLRRRLLAELQMTTKSFDDTEAMSTMIRSYVDFVNSDDFDPKNFLADQERREYRAVCQDYERALTEHGGAPPIDPGKWEKAKLLSHDVVDKWTKKTWLDLQEYKKDLDRCLAKARNAVLERSARELQKQMDRWLDQNGIGYFMHQLKAHLSKMNETFGEHLGEHMAMIEHDVMERANALQPSTLKSSLTLRGLGLLSWPQVMLLMMWLSPLWLFLFVVINQQWFWGILQMAWYPLVVGGAGIWWLLDFKVLPESTQYIDIEFCMMVLEIVNAQFELVFCVSSLPVLLLCFQSFRRFRDATRGRLDRTADGIPSFILVVIVMLVLVLLHLVSRVDRMESMLQQGGKLTHDQLQVLASQAPENLKHVQQLREELQTIATMMRNLTINPEVAAALPLFAGWKAESLVQYIKSPAGVTGTVLVVLSSILMMAKAR